MASPKIGLTGRADLLDALDLAGPINSDVAALFGYRVLRPITTSSSTGAPLIRPDVDPAEHPPSQPSASTTPPATTTYQPKPTPLWQVTEYESYVKKDGETPPPPNQVHIDDVRKAIREHVQQLPDVEFRPLDPRKSIIQRLRKNAGSRLSLRQYEGGTLRPAHSLPT